MASSSYKKSKETPVLLTFDQPKEYLDVKWKTMEYANPADPEVWGSQFWFSLHNGAERYPERASPIWAEYMRGFIMGIPVMLPCETCADHARTHIEQNLERMDTIVSGREPLAKFFVDFHNRVNKRYNKPVLEYKEARALYQKPVRVTKMMYS